MRDAIDQQQRPSGTGREIVPLVFQDILAREILVPEHGFITVALWVRSAAAYLKSRQLEKPGLKPFAERWYPAVADGLKEDIEARVAMGERKYGERLRAHNGRNALTDAYQELLDCWLYLRQDEEER